VASAGAAAALATTFAEGAAATAAEAATSAEAATVAAVNSATMNIVHTIMKTVQERFDVNCLSAEAKHSCADLTRTLAEFAENTLKNVTIVVLEDMLRNLKLQNNECAKYPEEKQVEESGNRGSFGHCSERVFADVRGPTPKFFNASPSPRVFVRARKLRHSDEQVGVEHSPQVDKSDDVEKV
jgi:hypothetical protein